MSTENNKDLYPMLILKDELKSDDITIRINALKRLPTVALALGVENSRTYLIPYIDQLKENEDEVLVCLAKEIPNLLPMIGGLIHAPILLLALENLTVIEETIVRQQAVQSILDILEEFEDSDEDINTFCQTLFQTCSRLSSGAWFTHRSSAAALIPHCYKCLKSEEEKLDLYNKFVKLCSDDTPMVRRAAATHLVELISNMESEFISNNIGALLDTIMKDEEDTVRMLSLKPMIPYSKKLDLIDNENEYKRMIINSINNLCIDSSWKVRNSVSECLSELNLVLNIPKVIFEILASLISDSEGEVKTAVIKQLNELLKTIKEEDIKLEILSRIKELIFDSSNFVRAALSSNLPDLACQYGSEVTIKEIVPLLADLVKDDHHEVRLNVISNINKICKVLDESLIISTILPILIELGNDDQWRIRLSILDQIPSFSLKLDKNHFNSSLLDLAVHSLTDKVFAVREAAATKVFPTLLDTYGVEWATTALFPHLNTISKSENVHHRISAILALSKLIEPLCQNNSNKLVVENIIPKFIELLQDKVANIRFNVVKLIPSIIITLKKFDGFNSKDLEIFSNQLKILIDDSDPDVKYFSQVSLEQIS